MLNNIWFGIETARNHRQKDSRRSLKSNLSSNQTKGQQQLPFLQSRASVLLYLVISLLIIDDSESKESK